MFSFVKNNTTNILSECYIASRIGVATDDYGNEVPRYSKPEKYMLNIMPATGELDIAMYGDRISSVYKTIVSKIKFLNKIKEGDIAYLHGVNPKGETSNTYGSNGNYIVNSVSIQNTVIAIHFKKLQE